MLKLFTALSVVGLLVTIGSGVYLNQHQTMYDMVNNAAYDRVVLAAMGEGLGLALAIGSFLFAVRAFVHQQEKAKTA